MFRFFKLKSTNQNEDYVFFLGGSLILTHPFNWSGMVLAGIFFKSSSFSLTLVLEAAVRTKNTDM